MKAQHTHLYQFLQGAKQFIVPIFQRTYSWETQQCEQLLDDVLRVGRDASLNSHFIGSVVYVADEDTNANIPRWQVIDGQQRLTTLTLLLIAFVKTLKKKPNSVEGVSVEEVEDYYLKNRYGKNDLKYKMLLTQSDKSTLTSLLDGKKAKKPISDNIVENFDYFSDRLSAEDLQAVYSGFKKLMIVEVTLERGQDDPQMIFESLNSTGLDLSQSDLIRNFVLMRQPPNEQVSLYEDIWFPMEQGFGAVFSNDFDKFVRDYLTLRTQPSRPIRAKDIYSEYKNHFIEKRNSGKTARELLNDLKTFAEYFVRYSLGKEKDKRLAERFSYLRNIVDLASPFIMTLYEHYEAGRLNKADFMQLVNLAESYVFRRSVCGMQTRSLGQIFAMLTYAISDKSPSESVKARFVQFNKNKRFPTDVEFKECLITRDVYDMRNCRFLLDRLENDSKEKIDTTDFTIEHVLPQTIESSKYWKEVLGEDWEEKHEQYIHRLGNLTLSGYNEKYSNLDFPKKKTMKNGFNDSPLRLNQFIKNQKSWDIELIKQRGSDLAEKAVKLWKTPSIDAAAVNKYLLEQKKKKNSHLTIEDVAGLKDKKLDLYKDLRKRVMWISEDTTEIFTKKNITYYTDEYFLQIIPKANRLLVILNIDFDEVDDDTGYCRDATKKAFIINSTEKGGVFLLIKNTDDIGLAMPFIKKAYEKVSG